MFYVHGGTYSVDIFCSKNVVAALCVWAIFGSSQVILHLFFEFSYSLRAQRNWGKTVGWRLAVVWQGVWG